MFDIQNRRSWQDDSRLSQSEFMLSHTGSGESGNNDSDNSMDDSRDSNLQRLDNQDSFTDKQLMSQSHGSGTTMEGAVNRRIRKDGSTITRRSSLGSTTGSVLSLGSAGTRRTVYLTEHESEEPSTILQGLFRILFKIFAFLTIIMNFSLNYNLFKCFQIIQRLHRNHQIIHQMKILEQC